MCRVCGKARKSEGCARREAEFGSFRYYIDFLGVEVAFEVGDQVGFVCGGVV